jgi:hypothetical protein
MKNTQRADLFSLLVLSIVVVIAFLTLSPVQALVPHRDSGIFLYVGSEILHGKILYQQIWEDKQPLLYLINALGLLLGKGSTWGVWGLELGFFIAVIGLCYKIVRTRLKPLFSLAVCLLTFMTIFGYIKGNYSEEYAILFQVGSVALLTALLHNGIGRRKQYLAALAFGISGGLAFCIKPTYIDVFLSALVVLFVYWRIKRTPKMPRLFLLIAAGFILCEIPFLIYFQAHGALGDYLQDAFLFNKYYSTQGLLEWIHGSLEELENHLSQPILYLSLAVWTVFFVSMFGKAISGFAVKLGTARIKILAVAFGIAFLGIFVTSEVLSGFSRPGILDITALILSVGSFSSVVWMRFTTRNATDPKKLAGHELLGDFQILVMGQPLLCAALIDYPIVLLLISISGNNFPHYYISLFVPILLLLTAVVELLQKLCNTPSHSQVLQTALIVSVICSSFIPTLQIVNTLNEPGKGDDRGEVAAYIRANTTEDDKILVWGWEAVIYYLADRESPTRFAIQFPAYFSSPYRGETMKTILSDLKNNPPVYIVDTNDSSMPLLEGQSIDSCLAANQGEKNNLQAIKYFVCSKYEYVTSIGEYSIYTLNP